MAVAKSYGIEVLQAINDVVEVSGVSEALSPITRAQVGTYQIAAFETLASSVGALADDIPDVLGDVIGEVADGVGEAASAVAGAIPFVGAAVKLVTAVVNIFGAMAAAQDAKWEEERRKRNARCVKLSRASYNAFGTGVGGAVTPSDLWVRAERDDFNRLTLTDRLPTVGAALQILTETMWPPVVLDSLMSTVLRRDAMPTWALGYPTEHWPCLFGFPEEWWHNMNGPRYWIAREKEWVLPMVSDFAPPLRRLRRAMVAQHPVHRRAKGSRPGDGGVSLWPLYQDLLYQMTSRPFAPFGSHNPFCTRGPWKGNLPVLYKPIVAAMYGGLNSEGFPSPAVFNWYTDPNLRGVARDAGWPDRSWMSDALGCRGYGVDPAKLLFAIVSNWDLTVRPQNAPEQDRAAKALAVTLAKAQDLAPQLLSQTGLRGRPIKTRADANAAVDRMQRQGFIGEQARRRARRQISGGAPLKAMAAILAGGAVLGGTLYLLGER